MTASEGQISQKDHEALLAALVDCRALIAAGKVQRWDVVKWTLTVNLGLATAAIALGQSEGKSEGQSELLFFLFSLLVAGIGGSLVAHYNKRMTGARNAARRLSDKMAEYCIEARDISGGKPYNKNLATYDWQELIIFTVIIFLSLLPPFVVWWWISN
jgi:hypothetical protein